MFMHVTLSRCFTITRTTPRTASSCFPTRCHACPSIRVAASKRLGSGRKASWMMESEEAFDQVAAVRGLFGAGCLPSCVQVKLQFTRVYALTHLFPHPHHHQGMSRYDTDPPSSSSPYLSSTEEVADTDEDVSIECFPPSSLCIICTKTEVYKNAAQ